MEENKQGKGLLIMVIILAILTLGMGGFIVYDKVLNPSSVKVNDEEKNDSSKTENTPAEEEEKTTESTNDEISADKENNVISNTTNTSKCTGTYYGESKGTYSNGISYDLKYTYVLNTDGTFTAKFGDTSGTNGVYVINDNTISFIGKDGTVGPRDEDPYYSTKDYVIADDCSYILVNEGTPFKVTKQ